MRAAAEDDIVVLIPVFNDWTAVELLLPLLDQYLREIPEPVRVLLVDDGSLDAVPEEFPAVYLEKIHTIEVLHLRRNLGHQRALATGMCYVEENLPCKALVVMDGDGEDAPADVPRLLSRFRETGDNTLVFAERTRRSESSPFRFFYWAYKLLHLLLTGLPVRVGNFSVIPRRVLGRLVVVSELWNHYAASVFKARIPCTMVPTERAPRLAQQSQMNFVSLVIHGLSAISVFGDRVGVRLMIAVSVLCLLAFCGLVGTLAASFLLPEIFPNWVAYTSGILLIVLVQMLTLLLIFVFVVLAGRGNSSFLPLRDYAYFVADARTVFRGEPVVSKN